MVSYSIDPENSTKSCKLRGTNLHVHFKNTGETTQAIKGIHIQKATMYLKDITLQKQCLPSHRYNKSWQACPGQTMGLDVGSVAQKECSTFTEHG